MYNMRDYKIDFDRKNIKTDLRKIVCELEKTDGVLAVYVFGSYVKNKMNDLSDVDICVIGNVSNKNRMDILLGKFSELFDISFFNDLPIWIRFKVFREGKCLVVRDNKKLNMIKIITLGEYLEFKPVINDIVKKELTLNV